MGPKGAKTAQNGPKCPRSDPKPRTKVPLRKATLSPCVWAPNSPVSPVSGHITAKNGGEWAPGGQRPKWDQKEPKQPKIGPNAPKMTPNSGQRMLYVRPPDHHLFDPVGGHITAKTRQKRAFGGQNGPKWGLKWPKMGSWRPKWA